MKKQPKKAKPVEAWATEVRRLKRIERAAKKVVRLCPGTELLDGLSRSLANSHELNLHREVSRSLRTKRTKP